MVNKLINNYNNFSPGILVAVLIAVASKFLSNNYEVPAMLMAILIGMSLNFLSEDKKCEKGINFSSKNILYLGIILLGSRITFENILSININITFLIILAVILTILFSILFLRLFGIKVNDSTNGFIFVSKKWLEGYKIIGNYNGAQQILLDAKLRNLKILEIDVKIKNRDAGKSFIGIRYPLNVITSMIALAIYRRTNTFLIFPGLAIILAGGILFLNDLILWISGFEEKIISNNVVLLTLFIGLQMISFGLVIEFLKKQKFI